MQAGRSDSDPVADSSAPPRVRFHTARLKDEEVRKRFAHMVDSASLEQQPHLAEMKGKFSRKEITAAEFAKAANQMIVGILQAAADEVIGRVSARPSAAAAHASTRHHGAKDSETRDLQATLQEAKNSLKWAQVHAPALIPARTIQRNEARVSLQRKRHLQRQDTLLGKA